MEATLKFDLPEDDCNHKIAVHSMDFALTCWETDQKLRSWLKYGHEFKNADEALEETRELLHEVMNDHGINLDMIE